MRLFIPYTTVGNTHSPRLKLSNDDENWTYPETLPDITIKITPVRFNRR